MGWARSAVASSLEQFHDIPCAAGQCVVQWLGAHGHDAGNPGSPLRILAIDPGSRCGYALGSGDRTDLVGYWDLKPHRGESPGVRYIRLRAQLQEAKAAYPDIGIVVYEQAHHRGGAATEYGVGVATHLQSWAAERGVEVQAVHSATVKKCATGHGNANKKAMREAYERLMGSPPGAWHLRTDDEIDAFWILQWAIKHFRATGLVV